MSKRHTEADVERLVEAAQYVLRQAKCYQDEQLHLRKVGVGWQSLDDITTALAPFLPEPEDALIEKMAEAFRGPGDGVFFPEWENAKEEVKTSYRIAARAALEVVKREGLPT